MRIVLVLSVVFIFNFTEADNKVYIINRGTAAVDGNRGWQKIRVIRNASGYTLQYAKITETTLRMLNIKTDPFYLVKDAAGNIYKLKFISFHSSDSGLRGKPVIEYKLVKAA